MSIQASILHKPRQVRWGAYFSHHRVATSMFTYITPRRRSNGQLKKTSNKRCSIFVLQTPFKFWIYMIFFEDFVSVLQIILLTKIKKMSVLVLGLHTKDRKTTRDKRKSSKQRLFPIHSQPHFSRLWWKYTWTLNTIYSTEGLPYWGFQGYVTYNAA